MMQLEIRNAVERDRLVYNGLGFVVGHRHRLPILPGVYRLPSLRCWGRP
ncbi:MAG: hypothetical protein WDN31_19620 [Hyphomicrobium sp.]